jgi:hypothetical protein
VARPDRRTRVADTIAPLAPVDIEHELAVVGRHFAGVVALQAASAAQDDFANIDLAVCDELDFGVIAAAQKAGIPVVVVSVIASGALVRPERLMSALEDLGRKLGMHEAIHPYGDFFVIPFAPAMRDPRSAVPAEALWMRPDPGQLPHSDGSVVATLGTEFNTESGDLFDRILSALADIETPATVAIGHDLNPTRFGPQPLRLRVEQYVDFDVVIPRASVVLHHGGSGLFVRSVLGGAAQIVFPMGADQPFTADRVRDLSLGRVLDAIKATPAAIAETINDLQTDARISRNVETLRLATLGLPDASAVVERLEASIECRRERTASP